jgi:K+-sensing histidine kinase KdpD
MKRASAAAVPYLRGTGIAIVAVVLRLALNPILGTTFPFLVSYPAVFLSARVGGPISAVVTTFLLTVTTPYFWLAPLHSFAIADEGDAIALFIFMGVGAVITGLAAAVQRAPRHLSALHGEADDAPNARNTADARLHAVADALRTSEVLIFVRKRAEKPEQEAMSPRAHVDVRARSSIWIAPSEGTACDTCGQPIKAQDIQYEIVAAGHDMCIDRVCYQRLIAAVEHGSLRLY